MTVADEHTFPAITPIPTATVAAEPDGELHGKVSGALRWSFANTVFTRLAQLGLSIVLAHLLAPSEFGVYAVALVVINITLSIAELGASVALVRYEGDPAEIAPTVTTIALATSTVLTVGTVIGAPYFSAAMGAPQATGVVRLLAVALLISGFTAVPGAMLQREFRQDYKMLADTASFVTSTLVVVVLALAGFGPWALGWSRIVANGTSAVVMIVLSKQRFWPGFDRSRAREILRFSIPLSGASLLVFAVLNVDYIVVGAILGPVALGLYLIAFNLSSWPVTAFSSSIRSVSVAGFAQLQGDQAKQRSGFASSFRILMTLSIPACVLLAVFATPLIRFVYGVEWVPAALPLTMLSVVGVLRIALELGYDYLAAIGRTVSILAIHALWLAGLIPALIVGARWDGIAGVGWGHLLTLGVLVAPAYVFVLGSVGLSFRSYASGVVRPILGGLAMVGVGILVTSSFTVDFWVLAVGGTASLGAYALVLLPGESGLLRWRTRRNEAHRLAVSN
jgi:O-antigen/teichoic acid export membrane protein